METTKKALEEVSSILNRAGWSDQSIHIGGSVTNSQVAQTMLNSRNIVNGQASGEAKGLLDQLQAQVKELIEKLPPDKTEDAERIAENLEMLVKQATSKKPDRKWYSLSAEGLLEASKFVSDFTGNVAGTLGQLGKLIWHDFSLPKPD
jgi:hypothetical protein